MVEKMTDICNANLSTDRTGRSELAVGVGASIVVAVATTIVLLLALLVATFAAPVHAASLAAADVAGEAAAGSGAISGIVVIAVLAGWLRVTADLWRAMFNRVRTWDLFRV